MMMKQTLDRLLFFRALTLLLFAETATCRAPGGDPSSSSPPPPPGDQAFVQSFTFELTAEEENDFTNPSDSPLYPPSNYKSSLPQRRRHDEKSDLDLTHQQLIQEENDYYAVVSTESIYSQQASEDKEWEMYKDVFLASWREFMFDQREMDENDDDEDDDDDANDGDGSCSMLSTAALCRSNNNNKPRVDRQKRTHKRRKHSNHSEEKRNKRRKPGSAWGLGSLLGPNVAASSNSPVDLLNSEKSLRSCLRFRGGAASASTSVDIGSEIMKRLFVSALVTLVFEAMMGHILEFLKIDMQTSTAEKYSYRDSVQKITHEKGIGGLWDGFIPWGVVQAICKGSVFGLAHAVASNTFIPLAEEGKISMQLALCLAGGIAGGFQGYVLSPTLLLKTRVMTDPVFRGKTTMLQTLYLSATVGFNVVRKEGLGSLMKGANVFATKRVFDWSTRYFFADLFEALFARSLKEGQSLSLLQKSYASLLGGVFSTCSTLPLDVLVSKTQDAKKAGEKESALALFKQELDSKGWNGLRRAYLRGFEARLLHVCLTVVVLKTFAPVVYQKMFG